MKGIVITTVLCAGLLLCGHAAPGIEKQRRKSAEPEVRPRRDANDLFGDLGSLAKAGKDILHNAEHNLPSFGQGLQHMAQGLMNGTGISMTNNSNCDLVKYNTCTAGATITSLSDKTALCKTLTKCAKYCKTANTGVKFDGTDMNTYCAGLTGAAPGSPRTSLAFIIVSFFFYLLR